VVSSLALLLNLQVRGNKTRQLHSSKLALVDKSICLQTICYVPFLLIELSITLQYIEIMWTCVNLPPVKKMSHDGKTFQRSRDGDFKQHVNITVKYQFFSSFLNFMIFSLKFGLFYY
jgi:hypothetical protein